MASYGFFFSKFKKYLRGAERKRETAREMVKERELDERTFHVPIMQMVKVTLEQ